MPPEQEGLQHVKNMIVNVTLFCRRNMNNNYNVGARRKRLSKAA